MLFPTLDVENLVKPQYADSYRWIGDSETRTPASTVPCLKSSQYIPFSALWQLEVQ